MHSATSEPRNIGSSELVTIDDVVTMHPCRPRLGPTTPLREGLAQLYPWGSEKVISTRA